MFPKLNVRSIRILRAMVILTTLTMSAVTMIPGDAVAAQNSQHTRKKKEKPKTIAVLGSSVAAGWVTSYETLRDLHNGYAYRLERLLDTRGWKVVNVSTPGDDTKKVLRHMERDLKRAEPGYVIIGLSMSNEGLETEDPEVVFDSYTQGLMKIIETCRERNMTPIVGLCYANDNFDLIHYAYIKKMNRLINTWDVASINLLGPLDDGRGRLQRGYTFDLDHPDDTGHEELFFAVVPSLFDALAKEKPLPSFETHKGYATVDKTNPGAPISFIPEDVMHSFTLAFDVRSSMHGRIAAIHGVAGTLTIDLDDEGQLLYTSASGTKVSTKGSLGDKAWHQVVVSHQYLRGRTELFLDGVSIGESNETMAPTQFILGGDRKNAGAVAAVPTDYRRLLIYRAPLNGDDVKALYDGAPIQASLEVFAPLYEQSLSTNTPLTNIAQSTVTLIAYPTDGPEAIAKLTEKIGASKKSKRVTDPDEKKPLTLSPAILKSYVGTYQSGPGMKLIITYEDERLLFSPNGQGRTELYAESQTEFFMRMYLRGMPPSTRLGITFHKGKGGKVDRLTYYQGHMNIKGKRVE